MAKKTTTRFSRWMGQRKEKAKETEEKFLNPLNLRLDGPGDVLTIDALDWRGLSFNVQRFRVLTRSIGGEDFPVTDYFLKHRGVDAGDVECVLRYVPIPDSDGILTHEVFLLKLIEESGHSDAVLKVLEANQGYTFFVPGESEGEWLEEDFPSRVNDVSLPYQCSVNTLQDVDGDGDIYDNEVKTSQLTYWDFWRLAENEDTEYLFVEVAGEDGWTTLFTGTEIDPAIVEKV